MTVWLQGERVEIHRNGEYHRGKVALIPEKITHGGLTLDSPASPEGAIYPKPAARYFYSWQEISSGKALVLHAQEEDRVCLLYRTRASVLKMDWEIPSNLFDPVKKSLMNQAAAGSGGERVERELRTQMRQVEHTRLTGRVYSASEVELVFE